VALLLPVSFGVSYDCKAAAAATFRKNRGSVTGQICVNIPDFDGSAPAE